MVWKKRVYAVFHQKKREARMKRMQMGAEIKGEEERRHKQASAQARDRIHSSGLSDTIRMKKWKTRRIQEARRSGRKSLDKQLAQTERRPPSAAVPRPRYRLCHRYLDSQLSGRDFSGTRTTWFLKIRFVSLWRLQACNIPCLCSCPFRRCGQAGADHEASLSLASGVACLGSNQNRTRRELKREI